MGNKGRLPMLDVRIVVVLLLVTAVCSNLGIAQAPPIEWKKVFAEPGQFAPCVHQMPDGSYRILGNRRTESQWATPFLLALSPTGEILWEKGFSDIKTWPNYQTLMLHFKPTSDGGYIVAGTAQGTTQGSTDVLLLKLDQAGNQQWQRTFHLGDFGDINIAIFVDEQPQGGFVLIGSIISAQRNLARVFLLGTDAEGNSVWQKDFSGKQWAIAMFAQKSSDGGYIIVGSTGSAETLGDILYVLKVNAAGDRIWEQYFSEVHYRVFAAVGATRDGGACIAACTDSTGGWTPKSYLLRLDIKGNVIWKKELYYYKYEEETFYYYYGFSSVAETEDEGFILGGTTIQFRSAQPAWTSYGCVVRTDGRGQILWQWLSDPGVWNPLDVTTRFVVVAGLTIEEGIIALVNRLFDDGTVVKALGFDIVKLAPITSGKGKVIGQIKDASTGQGIQGATVEASGPATTFTTTDASGNYTLSLPPGTYTLTASAPGYQPQIKTGIAVTAGQTTMVDFALTSTATVNHPPNPPTELAQLLPDGTLISVGGATSTTTIVFRGNVSDPDNDKVKLQVELRRLDELGGSFDETQGGLKDSEFVSSGATATAMAQSLIPASYHWRARTIDEHGLTSPWVEFGNNPANEADFSVTPTAAQGFWAQVTNAPLNRWTIRAEPNLKGRPIKEVPNGWVLFVRDTHDGQQQADGYIWWEVEDKTDGVTGWMAASYPMMGTNYLMGNAADFNEQSSLAERADPTYADSKEERINIIKNAVEHYYNNTDTQPSLYSSDDNARDGRRNAISDLKKYGFPLAVIFAIICQESGGVDYSNVGDGVMQIDWEGNKGLASNIGCFTNECEYYGNTQQSIYANVKDGLKVLRDFFIDLLNRKYKYPYVFAAWKFNGGVNPKNIYCQCKGDPFYLVHIGIRLSGDDLLEGQHICNGQTFSCWECGAEGCRKSSIVCGYSVPPTITDFGLDLQLDLGDTFKRCQRDMLAAAICSKAEVCVRDSSGRRTGIVGEASVEEIPNSICLGKTVVIFLPSEDYQFEVKGIEHGSYNLVINRFSNAQVHSVTATTVPVRPGSFHVYQVDWDAIALGEKGVTIQVDQDGDGIFERIVQAGREIRGDEIGIMPLNRTVHHGPNPVTGEGCIFWFNLPYGTQSAKILIYNVSGSLVAELPLDPTSSRYPATGRWNPVDKNGIPLANGPYIYVLIVDGKVIGQGKMVIQR